MLLEIDPVLIRLGPFAIRWYGVLMATFIVSGFLYLRRDALKLGYDEDSVFNLGLLATIGGIAGARAVYVLTNWASYAGDPLSIIRIDQGGLSFHGALIGACSLFGWYAWRKGFSVQELFDLVVPGICIGIILVRIGNLINGEVLGRTTELGFDRHPAQLIGAALGLVLLVLHNRAARKRPPAGFLFWNFVFVYSILRGFIEETVRENPLYAWGYVNETWGIGFFTLTHLITPLAIAIAWVMRRRALLLDRTPMGPRVRAGGSRR